MTDATLQPESEMTEQKRNQLRRQLAEIDGWSVASKPIAPFHSVLVYILYCPEGREHKTFESREYETVGCKKISNIDDAWEYFLNEDDEYEEAGLKWQLDNLNWLACVEAKVIGDLRWDIFADYSDYHDSKGGPCVDFNYADRNGNYIVKVSAPTRHEAWAKAIIALADMLTVKEKQ